MPSKRIVFRVLEEVGCPLFRSGDQMVLALPGVDKDASSNVCTLVVAQYLAARNDDGCARMDGANPWSELYCPRSNNPVRFEVHEIEEPPDAGPMLGALTGDISQAVAALRQVHIFRSLPAAVLGRLAQHIRLEAYRRGETVLEKGMAGRAFFIVHAGTLEVVDYADTEVSAVVAQLKPKDTFGEMALLTHSPVAARVVAQTDVTLLAIPKEDFDRLLRENTYLAGTFTRLLAARLQSANVRLVKEGSKPFSGKLQEMSLATVLQVLGDSARSGTLFIDNYQRVQGRIAFNHGRIFEMSLGDLEGEAALHAMLKWTKGDFWLDKKLVPEVDKVEMSVMALLLEGMRILDESERATEDLPGLDDVP